MSRRIRTKRLVPDTVTALRGAFFPMAPWGGAKLLALLLVGAILLCHGLLWSLHHQCSALPVSADGAHEHRSPAGAGSVDHEDPGCHLMGATDYFVLTLAIVLGAVLGLLLKGARLWGRTSLPPPFSPRRLRTPLGHAPRGPTSPTLQVFRL